MALAAHLTKNEIDKHCDSWFDSCSKVKFLAKLSQMENFAIR
jgi:hypothetical protein